MKDKNIHEKEIAEHNYRHINKIIGDQYSCSEFPSKLLIFSSEGWLRDSISLRSEGDNEKKAISDAEAKPEASKSTPAKIIATIAEKEGWFTVIPLKMSAKWHK